MRKAVVCGGGGFIGHHLTKRLKAEGVYVRAVDLKRPEFEESPADDFLIADLRNFDSCVYATRGMDDVYQLAADMGGIGYITSHHAAIARHNSLINLHMLEAARIAQVDRFLFSSSACVYPAHLQDRGMEPMTLEELRRHNAATRPVLGLKEDDAVPADPEPGYGWEKLYAEQLASYYAHDFNLRVRIARFHNIYGPLGTWQGGKEKAPAAICRKVAFEFDNGEIEVWGDGKQTRSFCFIDDCVDGVLHVMGTEFEGPVNVGSEELVTVDRMVEMVIAASGKKLSIRHDPSKPQGVRGRNSDNTLMRQLTGGWEPKTPLEVGLAKTYEWIHGQIWRPKPASAA